MSRTWPRRAYRAAHVGTAAVVAFAPVFLAGAAAQEQAPARQETAQPQPPAAQPQAPVLQPPAQAPAPPPPNAVSRSDAELILELVRSTLTAVQQADLTGNYTVLRDLGAPGFREKNSAADLAQIFAPIRQQKIDLGPVVFLDPQLSRAAINPQGMLHLAGRLATRPVPVNFELLFQPVNGVWKLFGISISPIQQPASASPPPPAANVGTAKSEPAASPPKHRPPRHAAKPPHAGQPAPAQPDAQAHQP